jgi:hypothetical protein
MPGYAFSVSFPSIFAAPDMQNQWIAILCDAIEGNVFQKSQNLP